MAVERGRAGEGFPGEVRDQHMSPRVCLRTAEGFCRGLCLGGAGCRECFSGNSAPISRHRRAGTPTAEAQLWFGHPQGYHVPLHGERAARPHGYQERGPITCTQQERWSPNLVGWMGVSQPSPRHPRKSPHVNPQINAGLCQN